jgi:polysaccharide biosynthesis transport protein
MEEYEVDLRDYLHVLWREKWIVVATFLVAVVTALVISYSLPKQYQTETSLLILPPLATEVAGEVTGTVFSPATYKRLALANDLLEETIGEAYPKGGGPSVSSLQGQMKVEVEQTNVGDFPGRFPLYLKVTFTGSDPDKLPQLAEVWARRFTAKNAELFLSRTAQSYDYVKQNFDDVERELAAKEGERKLLQQENPEQVIQAEVQILQQVYQSYLGELSSKKQVLATEQARLFALNTALDKEPEHFTLQRGLSAEALWNFLSSTGLSQDQLASIPELEVQDEVLNDAFVSLRDQLAQTEVNVDGLRAEISYLESEAEKTRSSFQAKQAQLFEVEAAVKQMDREIQVFENAYNSLAARLQEASIARVETPDPIRIVEAPIVPKQPIGPRKKMNVAVAGVLGLFAGVLLAFFAHYLKSGNEDKPIEASSQALHGEHADKVS